MEKLQTFDSLVSKNDFVIKFANVNGSGSASANQLFAKAVFRMGIPVSPKNIFPSNIQGLPTWFEIRINKDGYLGSKGSVDLSVAMNPQATIKTLKSSTLVDIFYMILLGKEISIEMILM
jgi:2-oxoglutarate ferredoxin oxidoreductase subunit alpha